MIRYNAGWRKNDYWQAVAYLALYHGGDGVHTAFFEGVDQYRLFGHLGAHMARLRTECIL